jgi:hypothetical protein
MEKYTEELYNYLSKNNLFQILTYYKQINNLNIPNENIKYLNEKINLSIFSKIIKLFFRSKNIANFCNKNNIDISISH